MGQVAEGVYGNFVQMVTAADGLLPRNAGCSGNQASMGCLRAASLQGMLPPRVENTFVQHLHFLSVFRLWAELCTVHPQLVGCSPGLELPECDYI